MNIKSLEKMEEIVSSNNNLFWDGWVVVSKYKSEKARTSKDGMLINGKWYLTKRFIPSKNGWEIPEKLVIKNAQT